MSADEITIIPGEDGSYVAEGVVEKPVFLAALQRYEQEMFGMPCEESTGTEMGAVAVEHATFLQRIGHDDEFFLHRCTPDTPGAKWFTTLMA